MKPLCVDCDGTLICSDLMHESLLRILLRKPWLTPVLIYWLLQGRSVLKQRVASLISLDITKLPFRPEVVEFVRRERSKGSKTYLVTGASEHHAKQIARHLDIFDDLFYSDERRNLRGHAKAEFLAEKFGQGGFHYIGDSIADFPVWKEADIAIVAGGSAAFFSEVQKINPKATHFLPKKTSLKDWLNLIRVHQWAKNIIIFVPLVTAHQVFNSSHVLALMGAFISLSFVASATYILNDMLDLDNDRSHKNKKHRSLASGSIGILAGAGVGVLFALAGIGIASLLPTVFGACLGLYVALTVSYTFYLKKIVLADAIILAGLYTLRLLIGHAATGIPISVWLLAFSIFLFFSLALVKRYVEIGDFQVGDRPDSRLDGRGYQAADLWLIGTLGVSCGMVSVLVLILYVNSPDVKLLYTDPILLMLLAPIFLFWIGRIWLLASRGKMHEDPVLFALSDKSSYLLGLLTLFIILIAAGSK